MIILIRVVKAALFNTMIPLIAFPCASHAGQINGTVYHAAAAPAGKIYIAGSFTAVNGEIHDGVARLNANGTVDSSFTAAAPGGGFAFGFFSNGSFLMNARSGNLHFTSAGVLNSSYPTVWGNNTLIMESDGTFFTSYGKYRQNGTLIFSYAATIQTGAMVKQPDGKLLLGGGTGGSGNLFRLNSNGSRDNSFVPPAGIYGGNVAGLAVQADGKIVVTGDAFALMPHVFRLNPNGSMDNTFTPATPYYGPAYCLPDGSILISNGSGSTEITFAANGRIVSAGSLVRLTTTGALHPVQPNLDNAFDQSLGVSVYLPLTVGPPATDTDHDGVPDNFETGTGVFVSAEDTGTSPVNPDTDADGFSDGFEVISGFNPTRAKSTPEDVVTLWLASSGPGPAREFRFNAANGVSYRIERSADLTNWTTVETNIIGLGGTVPRSYPESLFGDRCFLRARRH
jgi:uncharacterized delta-60 repeat protein